MNYIKGEVNFMENKKKIVLIGDSIRMGYDKYVKEALSDCAEVYYPTENCRFAQYVLRFVHEWKSKGEWPTDVDLVHWNAGLWDCVEMFGDEPLTSYTYYSETIKRIHRRLKLLFPNAKIVFATSTAVQEEKYGPTFKRHNSTREKFNQTAKDALSDTDAIINDLYAITKNLPEEYHSDLTHYYPDKGVELIGGKVLSVICKELGISASEVNIENFEPEKYSKSNIGC